MTVFVNLAISYISFTADQMSWRKVRRIFKKIKTFSTDSSGRRRVSIAVDGQLRRVGRVCLVGYWHQRADVYHARAHTGRR